MLRPSLLPRALKRSPRADSQLYRHHQVQSDQGSPTADDVADKSGVALHCNELQLAPLRLHGLRTVLGGPFRLPGCCRV